MLGSGLPAQQAVVLSVVPGQAREGQASAVAKGACDAAAGGDGCGAGSSPAGPLGQAGSQGREQAGLETVLPAPTEEPNSTDSAKAPKVNCEERNITGIDHFTLQILNVSQVSRSRSSLLGEGVRMVEDASSARCGCFFLCLTWWISLHNILCAVKKQKYLGKEAFSVILNRKKWRYSSVHVPASVICVRAVNCQLSCCMD